MAGEALSFSQSAEHGHVTRDVQLDRAGGIRHDEMMKEQKQTAPQGIIFDFDGTLADTLDDITDSINALFANSDVDIIPYGRVRELIGMGLQPLLQSAFGIDDQDRLADLVKRYCAIYPQRMLSQTALYPGVADSLNEFSSTGVAMAVLSNKPDEFTVPMCEGLLGSWHFAAFRGAREQATKKPDPTQALELAEIMKRDPGQVIFVGDSAVDIQTARNAGMTAVAVTWGYRDREELADAKPDVMIDTPGELPDSIRKLRTSNPL